MIASREAIALPADRTALDAMLAEARKEQAEKDAGICEDMAEIAAGSQQLALDLAADAIRQAAERGE